MKTKLELKDDEVEKQDKLFQVINQNWYLTVV